MLIHASKRHKYSRLILDIYIPIILLIFVPVWIFGIAPILKKMPRDFVYTANILSLDNFYNEKLKLYEGEQISKTTFTYRVVREINNELVILNTFDVRSLDNKRIFTANREYYIDPFTWKHTQTILKERSGYLWGPHYATKNNFNYWHINYDAPANMIFQNEEMINGLNVYRYETLYYADQSRELSYLSGVPHERGIRTKVKLQLWIEPISGWLINYQDNSIAYFYDKRTGEILFPWNKFSNRYTLQSINQQVRHAIKQKWKIIAIDILIPGFMVLLASLLIAKGLLTNSNLIEQPRIRFNPFGNIRYIGYELALLALVGMILTAYQIIKLNAKPQNYTVGIALWNKTSTNDYIKGFQDGLKERGFVVGKNLQLSIKNADQDIETQIQNLHQFAQQKVDLIFTLTTPGTLVAKGVTSEIPIVFTDVTYPAETGIITSIKDSKNNLVGVRNYISAARQFYELDKLYPNIKSIGFVHHKGDPDSNFQLAEFKNTLTKRNIQVIDLAAIDVNHLEQLLNQYKHLDAIFLACDTLAQEGADKAVIHYSKLNKIPSLSCNNESVKKGVLLGYSTDPYSLGKRTGVKASLILQGADPSWLETTSGGSGYLDINTSTADAIGLKITPEIKLEANKLFQ